MDIRRIAVVAVLILLLCFTGLWGARIIQEEQVLPVQKQQTSPKKNTAQQTTTKKAASPQQPGQTAPRKTSASPTMQAPAQAVPAQPQARQPVRPVTQAVDSTPGAQSGQFITMDFDGVDVKVFIKFVADITGKNFIVDEKVSGKVTVISPRKMSIDEAYRVFLSVLEVNGLGTVDMGGVIKVVRNSDAITKSLATTMEPPLLSDDTMITQIIPLKFVDAEDMKNLLSPLMSKTSSQLLSYPQSNLLIVTDTKSNIRKIMDILRVVDMAGFAQEVRIYPLTYASAADLSSKLSDILSEGKDETVQRVRTARQAETTGAKTATKIIPYERTNSLIVLAPPTDVAGIEDLIRKLDIPTPSGKEDIHVYYLQYASAEDMAKVLSEMPTPDNPETPQAAATGQQAAAAARPKTVPNPALKEQNIKISPDKETNSLIIYADPYSYKSLLETIKYLDIPRKQVYVKALIMEVNSSKDFKVGVEWTYFDDFKYDGKSKSGAVFGRTGSNFITSPADLPSGALLGVIGQTITIGSGDTKITFPNMSAFINAMSTDSDVNIISAPQILTMDNKEAEIKVGKNVPYLTRQDTDTTNINRTVNSYDYRDVGVTLKLTPQINQQGNIRMSLFQETTTLVAGTGEAEFAPTTLKRSASTTVTIKDGNTMVIGGLKGDTLSLGNSRVPLLGDIPILGYLFKSLSRNREKTTLYIFLTPQIIDTEQKVEALYKEKSKESEDEQKSFGKGTGK
ncbi:MAG: type II secretion system secretin GspD [Syntrophaceae bacterium]